MVMLCSRLTVVLKVKHAHLILVLIEIFVMGLRREVTYTNTICGGFRTWYDEVKFHIGRELV